MSSLKDGQSDDAAGRKSSPARVREWFSRRTGIDALLDEALSERIPGGARITYVFGSGLLFLFLSQVVTGVALALYYVPSADHAHTSVAYIVKVVSAGWFLRSLHVYGASAILIVLALHLTQVFLYGSYKGRRELLWGAGCVLLALVLGIAFTGYLLPWDQNAYFATAVGTNMLDEVPLVGHTLKLLVRGGVSLGTLTISRFYVLHAFLLPAAIFGLIAAHVYLFRKAGAAGPTDEDPFTARKAQETFYPRQLLMDMTFALLIMAALGLLAYWRPAELGTVADPTNTQYLPRPEWYYRPMFEWLKFWTEGEVWGIVVIPAMVAVLFVAVPFLDRRRERRPLRRPVAVGTYAAAFLALSALGVKSYTDDAGDPAVALKLREQHEATQQYMQEPFQPQRSGILTVANSGAVDVTQGKTLFEQHCATCHYVDSTQTKVGPGLKDLLSRDRMVNGQVPTSENVREIISHGYQEMPPFNDTLTEKQIGDVEAYMATP